MKAFVHSQMNFENLKGKCSENKLTNKLMDLTWLLQHHVKCTIQRRQLEVQALPSGRPSLKSKADHDSTKLKRKEKAKLCRQLCSKDRIT